MDHSTRCGTPFSTYTLNLVKISWSPEICLQNEIWKTPPGGEMLLPVLFRHHWGTFVSVIVPSFSQSDKWRPSYGHLTNSKWAPSAILDIRGGRTGTIPHVAGPHVPRTHQIWWRYLHRRRRYAPKTEFEKTPPGGGILFPVSTLTPALLRGSSCVSSCKMSAISDNRRLSYSDLTILLFGPIMGSPLRQLISVLGKPTPSGWYH